MSQEKKNIGELADDTDVGQEVGRADYAKVGELEVEATEDKIRISGTWGQVVFGSGGETVEDAIESLANIVTDQPDPRPDDERDIYRCDGERPWQRCRNCDDLMSADHHEVLGTDIVACSWDDINDFDIFEERDGRVVKCPDCGGDVRDRPSEHVDGLANVDCRDCGEEFFRESHDFGDHPAGSQELKRTTDDYEVVARVH